MIKHFEAATDLARPVLGDDAHAAAALTLDMLDPTRDPDWDNLVSSHPDSTFFHRAAWIKVLSRTYGHTPLALVWSRDGRPVAILILMEVASHLTGRRGVSLPFTDLCEPLFFDICDPDLIFQKLHALAHERRWKHFEIRGNFAARSAQPSISFYGHTIDLRVGAKGLLDRLAGSARRAIRKAEQSGLQITVSTSEEAIRDFYRLHVQTRRRHGLPPQPFAFFQNIHAEILNPGLGFVVLARQRENPIAAAVFFHGPRNAIYKFGASDQRAYHLRPNNLIMWHAIQRLARNGFEQLHLGRTSHHNEGLRRFKLSWGSSEETIEYFRYDTRIENWSVCRDSTFGIHNAIFSRLPSALNRMIGAAIYPHLD